MGLIDPRERLIFALDVTSREEAERFVNMLDGLVSFFKIGIVLNLVVGIDFIKWLKERDKRVFLDLKYFDIGKTVEGATKQAARLGVDFLTVHGNREIIEAACAGRGEGKLKILAVTLLTSLDTNDLKDLGFNVPLEDLVLYRAEKAVEAGCDGIIASGREAGLIRERTGERLLIVTPGIRPKGVPQDDHRRSTTPGEAIRGGADYLVIGRPIRNAPDPRAAVEEILKEMETAFRERTNS